MPDICERSFEEAIECGLLQYGPDALPDVGAQGAMPLRETSAFFGEMPSGGYRKRMPEEYDRSLCLIPRDAIDFIYATQPKDRVFIRSLEERLVTDPALVASIRANTPENARLTFDYVVTDRLQDMVDTNFKFYKRITDDREFSKYFLDWLFDRLRKSIESEKPEGNYTQK